MGISPVTPNTSAYHTPTINNKQTNNPLDTLEGTQAKSTRPGDTVSISQEASQKARLEEYPLQSDPVEIFNKWKSEGRSYPTIGYESKPFDDLLPENQELISNLRDQAKNTSNEEERRLIEADISIISSYGDKEIFSSREDANKRLMTESQAATLEMRYLIEKNGGESIFESNQGYQIPTSTEESIQRSQPSGFNEESLVNNQQPSFQVSSLEQFNDKEFLKGVINLIYGQDSDYVETKV